MGRSTLTTEIASQLEALWQLSGDNTLTDEEICGRIGISRDQLNGWLKRNRSVVRENGVREKLRHIRVRAKATTKSSYLQKLYSLAIQAENARDFRTAINSFQWLLEKQFPKNFGNRQAKDMVEPETYGVLRVGNKPSKEQWAEQSKQMHKQQKQRADSM